MIDQSLLIMATVMAENTLNRTEGMSVLGAALTTNVSLNVSFTFGNVSDVSHVCLQVGAQAGVD